MNKLCLIDRTICPPEPYFRYVFPEDGYEALATTHDGWMTQAGMHAQANGLASPSSIEMEEQLCRTLPPGWCRYDDPNRPRPLVSLGWEDVVGALNVFKSWLTGGLKTVDQAEADRRALVCSRCYLNTNVTGCAGCQKLVGEVVGNLKTKYDFALKSCAVCKCVLRAAVHFPVDVMTGHENASNQEMYPSHCWKKIGGENHESTQPATRSSSKG